MINEETMRHQIDSYRSQAVAEAQRATQWYDRCLVLEKKLEESDEREKVLGGLVPCFCKKNQTNFFPCFYCRKIKALKTPAQESTAGEGSKR